MNITVGARAALRTTIGTYFRVARMPLDVAISLTGNKGNAQWAPALAFEKAEAAVETTLGGWLADPILTDKGTLRAEKIAQLGKAAELETKAAEERARAAEQLERDREQAERKRVQAEQTAQQRETQLQQQARKREQELQQKAAAKEAAARKAEQARLKSIQRQDRAAKTVALAKEEQALTAEKQALEADMTIDLIDASLEGAKADRTGR